MLNSRHEVGSWILFGPQDLPDIQICLEFRRIREFTLSFVDKASAEFVGSIPARPFDLKWPDKPSRVRSLCRVTIFIDGAGDRRFQGILVVPRDFQQSWGAGEINSLWKFRVFDALPVEAPFECRDTVLCIGLLRLSLERHLTPVVLIGTRGLRQSFL